LARSNDAAKAILLGGMLAGVLDIALIILVVHLPCVGAPLALVTSRHTRGE